MEHEILIMGVGGPWSVPILDWPEHPGHTLEEVDPPGEMQGG